MTVFVAVLITVAAMTGYKGSKVALSLYALELGASQFTTGLLISVYAISPLMLAVPAGKSIDRMGFFWPLMIGVGSLALGLAIPFAAPSVPLLFLGGFVIGTGFTFFSLAIQSMIGALGSAESRTRDFTNFSLGPALGTLIGPLLVGVCIDHFGNAWSCLLLALVPLAGCILIVAKRKAMPRPDPRGDAVYRSADLVAMPMLRNTLVVSGIVMAAVELFTFYMPVYGHSIDLSATWIGAIVSAYAAASFAVRIFLPDLTARFSEQTVLTWALFCAAATFLLFPLFTSPWPLFATGLLLGLGLGCGQPLALVLIYTRAPKGRSAEALGLRISVNKIAELVCPLLFGSIGSAFGVGSVFAGNALLLVGGGWVNRLIKAH